MARYDHLPVYKKAMELSVYLEGAVRNFSRYDKYSIGAELRALCRQVLGQIIRANSLRDMRQRQDALRELVATCELLKTVLFLAKESRAFQGFNAFQHATTLAVVLSKQSEGWLKSSTGSPNHRPSPATGR